MATPHVTTDTFICGVCQKYFNDLVTFLEHKRSTSCGITVSYDPDQTSQVTLLSEAAPDEKSENPQSNTQVVKTTKRRGRPKKRKLDPEEQAEEVEPTPAPTKTASIGPDGSYICDLCKSKFKRERHFKSHRCNASDIYVKPEDIPELEEGFDSRKKFPVASLSRTQVNEDLPEIDEDETDDYRPAETEQVGDDTEGENVEEHEEKEEKSTNSKRKTKRRYIVATDATKKLKALSSKRQIASYPIPQTLDDIPDIPVFPTDEARLEFEKKEITVVDLSQTDSMYKTHMIEQTMNENAYPLPPRSQTEITLYSCNTCERVFKSLSHIRYHCLTHIDAKPFKCPEQGCTFKSNSKGNIYSHMRKHTGQMYRCRTCGFQSVNKTHLLEHEATHSSLVHKCIICKKHYSTVKSLINHIRKYHRESDRGKEYLSQFVSTKEGPGAALLYECHICDRKFKKQSDRDRHLYVHNVRVEHTLHKCELCQYETARQTHLNTHFIKHKYVYGCEYCGKKFLSVIATLDHISAEHKEESQDTEKLNSVSIEKSLYLPEEKQTVVSSNILFDTQADDGIEKSIYDRLGYLPMTVELFESFRKKFGTYECSECGNLFKTADDCSIHSKTHQGERPFSCPYCDHLTFSRNSLKLHINANHEDQLFKCDQCDFVSKGKVALVEHRQRHEHMECPLCKQFAPGRKALRNHLLSKHSEVDAETARRLSGYGRRTDAMKAGKAFKCPYCDKSFMNNNTELQKHIWSHEGIKPFKCDVCDYSCRTRSNLTSHMLRHTEHKPFPCSVCGKKYKSKTALRWHERSHASGKLFKCNKCSYEATQKSHLVRHMETHNILKRFSCNHCYFSANTIGYMRIHYTRFHPGMNYSYDASYSQSRENAGSTAAGSNSPPVNVYKCVSCDYLFGNLSDMKRHLRMRHRIHIADMRQTNNETVTQIMPMENADGITSDVQIIHIPMEEDGVNNYIQAIPDSSILVGDAQEINTAGVQLIELPSQDIETAGDDQQIIIQYPDTDGSLPDGTFNPALDTPSIHEDVIVQSVQEVDDSITTTPVGAVSLLKAVSLRDKNQKTAEERLEDDGQMVVQEIVECTQES